MDVFVPEIGLDSACVGAVSGEPVASGVPEHMRVDRKLYTSLDAGASDYLMHCAWRKRRLPVGGEYECRGRLLCALQFSQSAQLVPFYWLNGLIAVLDAVYVEPA